MSDLLQRPLSKLNAKYGGAFEQTAGNSWSTEATPLYMPNQLGSDEIRQQLGDRIIRQMNTLSRQNKLFERVASAS
jgi:hypothetical protein